MTRCTVERVGDSVLLSTSRADGRNVELVMLAHDAAEIGRALIQKAQPQARDELDTLIDRCRT